MQSLLNTEAYMRILQPMFASRRFFWLSLAALIALASPTHAKRAIKRNHLNIRHAITGEFASNLWVMRQAPKNPDRQWVGSKARKRLERFLRDTRTNKTTHIPEQLLYQLYLIGYHFDAPIEIVTGYRSGDPDEDRHRHGKAVDFRVVGVDAATVWTYAQRFKHTGVGLYPKANFVHMDVREEPAVWTAGKRSRCRDRAEALLKEHPKPVFAKKKTTTSKAETQQAKKKKTKATKVAKAKKANKKKAKKRRRKKKKRRIRRYHMTLYQVNSQELVEDLWVIRHDPKNRDKQWVGKRARKRLQYFLRDLRTGKQRKVPERLLWQLYLVAQHFDARVEIVSGYRSKERNSSRHRHGKAADFRVEGVDPKRVWNYCKRFKRTGLGYYPTSKFVHMDIRKRSAYWIDDSGPGQKSRYRSNVKQPKDDRRKKRRSKKKKRKRA